MVTYHIQHDTEYDYYSAVTQSRQILRLSPRILPWQGPESHVINIDPCPDKIDFLLDCFGNPLQYFTLMGDHNRLAVRAHSVVSLTHRRLPDSDSTPPWEEVVNHLRYMSGRTYLPYDFEATQFRFESNHIRLLPAIAQWARQAITPGMPVLAAVGALQARIFNEFVFDPQATTIATPVLEVFQKRRGVCQDFAHFMISCLRAIGLAARYVSGYLLTHPPAGQPRLIGADASHAWVSVYIPGHGWVDSDPTNNVFPDQEHITLCWGRDFSDVSPIRGMMYGSSAHSLKTSVTVMPESEMPR
ncbi:transglutaminase family protein [Advenella kashmirensis]